MNGPRRIGFRHVLAIGAIAGALAACGVKGPLEEPPSATAPSASAKDKQQAAAPSTSTKKIFAEGSAVRSVKSPTAYPLSPREQWSKGRDVESSPPVSGRDKKGGPDDEPFFLDKLL